jgi:hypothetical protein
VVECDEGVHPWGGEVTSLLKVGDNAIFSFPDTDEGEASAGLRNVALAGLLWSLCAYGRSYAERVSAKQAC